MEHKLITGGGQFLPFARSRIKALRATGLKYASQQFDVDGVSIKVRIEPGQEYITLSGGDQSGYQFFTTGPSVALDSDLYRGYSLKAALAKDPSDPESIEAKARAIASTLEAGTPAPGASPKWRFIPLASDISTEFPRKHVWQIQGIPEYAYFARDPSAKAGSGVAAYPFLVSSWSQANPLATQGVTSGEIYPNIGMLDIIYDVAPSLFARNSGSPKGGGNGIAPDADWYKRAAFTRVEHHEYGARTFIVLADVSNVFHVYPSSAPTDGTLADGAWSDQWIKTSMDEAYVKRQTAPLPDWVRQGESPAREIYKTGGGMDGVKFDEYLRAVPQYLWSFNSDCTRACAIVHEDIAGIAIDDVDATIPLRADGLQITESLPGLVEMNIAITITGPEPGDFTFSLTLGTALRATVTKDYLLAAAYAWNVPDAANLDDLIVLAGEIYHASSDRQLAASASCVTLDLTAIKGVVHVRNLTQATAIRTFLTSDTNLPYAGERVDPNFFSPQTRWPEATYFEASAKLLAFDLRILAFAIQQRYIEQDLTGDTVGPGYLPGREHGVFRAAQRVKVYAYNQLADEKIMDADSPLDAKLVAAFAGTATGTLFRYPVDDVGYYRSDKPTFETPGGSFTHTAYVSLDILDAIDESRASSYSRSRFASDGGNLNAGAYLYATRMASALQMGSSDGFTVHPSGHWSITSGPIFYYSGASTDLLNKYPFAAARAPEGKNEVDPALMKQTHLDIVNFRHIDKSTGLRDDKRSTHLALFNQAFGKSYAAQDFEYTFSVREDLIPDTSHIGAAPYVQRTLVAQSATPGVADEFEVYRNWSDRVGSGARQRVGQGNPAYLDARRPGRRSNFEMSGPVLRGASLFY